MDWIVYRVIENGKITLGFIEKDILPRRYEAKKKKREWQNAEIEYFEVKSENVAHFYQTALWTKLHPEEAKIVGFEMPVSFDEDRIIWQRFNPNSLDYN